MTSPTEPTVVIVPGLRDHMPEHWQSLLADRLQAQGRAVQIVPQIEENKRVCAARIANLERVVSHIQGPVVLVAHSIGCMITVHWAQHTQCKVQGALLAAPADLDTPMPEGYTTTPEMWAKDGWTPIPRKPLPFQSIVVSSHNDPLGQPAKVKALAEAWGSRLVNAGAVGHLSPADGYGNWPLAEELLQTLSTNL